MYIQRWIGGAVAVLLALGVYAVIQKARSARPFDAAEELKKAFEAAQTASDEILNIESKAWLRGESFGTGDLAAIRSRLETLEDRAERIQSILELVRGREAGVKDSEVEEMAQKLLGIKLRILDAADLVEDERKGAQAGFYIPLRIAIAAWRKAEAELREIEKSLAEEKEAAAVEKASGRIAEIEKSFSEAAERFARLEDYLKKGLTREDLEPEELPELALLREESRLLAEARDRVKRFLPAK